MGLYESFYRGTVEKNFLILKNVAIVLKLTKTRIFVDHRRIFYYGIENWVEACTTYTN